MNENIGTYYTAEIVEVIDANRLLILFNGTEIRECRLFGVQSPEYAYTYLNWKTQLETAGEWDTFPESLKRQEFSEDAYDLVVSTIIDGSESATPVGVQLGTIIRGKTADNILLVTILNTNDIDIGTSLISSGFAFLHPELIPSHPLYNAYMSARNQAMVDNLNIWSKEPSYLPSLYISDVDYAATRLLYIVIDSSNPINGYVGQYIDDPILVTFSREIESSYVTPAYFKLYRTNSTKETFDEQILCTITKGGEDNKVINISPNIHLSPSSSYIVLIMGSTHGIEAIDGSRLLANQPIVYTTATTVRPSAVQSDINDILINVDGDIISDISNVGRDLFSTDIKDLAISLVSSVPSDKSVGVNSLNSISLIFKDNIQNTIPVELISFKYSELPVDSDPLGDRNITITDVTTTNNIINIKFTPITSETSTNREYTLKIPTGVIFGTTYGKPNKEISIKFIGRLSPLYTVPHDIKMRMAGWNDTIRVNISDYELYKLALQKSILAVTINGTPDSIDELIQIQKLVLCLILLDLVVNDSFFGGGIKSRELLSTKVQYYETNIDDILEHLEECIESASVNGTAVAVGIKSGAHLSRQGKNYNQVYR